MAFPNTPVLDNFNRANEGPPPSANWVGWIMAASNLIVYTNVCACNVAGNGDAGWDTNLRPPR